MEISELVSTAVSDMMRGERGIENISAIKISKVQVRRPEERSRAGTMQRWLWTEPVENSRGATSFNID